MRLWRRRALFEKARFRGCEDRSRRVASISLAGLPLEVDDQVLGGALVKVVMRMSAGSTQGSGAKERLTVRCAPLAAIQASWPLPRWPPPTLCSRCERSGSSGESSLSLYWAIISRRAAKVGVSSQPQLFKEDSWKDAHIEKQRMMPSSVTDTICGSCRERQPEKEDCDSGRRAPCRHR